MATAIQLVIDCEAKSKRCAGCRWLAGAIYNDDYTSVMKGRMAYTCDLFVVTPGNARPLETSSDNTALRCLPCLAAEK